MPDLRPATRYQAAMTRVEQAAVRDAAVQWRQAAPALVSAAQMREPTVALQTTLASVRRALGAALPAYAGQADALAHQLVATQAGVPLAQLGAANVGAILDGWQAAALGLFLAEHSRLQAQGADRAAILDRLVAGDGRASVAQQVGTNLVLATATAIWSAGNGAIGRYAALAGERAGERYQRQAIAALDRRTTDCCLRVHGQIVDLDQPFTLSGTPRYADRVAAPPFHWNCRTAIALYHPAMEAVGTPTTAMRAAARAQLTVSSASRTR